MPKTGGYFLSSAVRLGHRCNKQPLATLAHALSHRQSHVSRALTGRWLGTMTLSNPRQRRMPSEWPSPGIPRQQPATVTVRGPRKDQGRKKKKNGRAAIRVGMSSTKCQGKRPRQGTGQSRLAQTETACIAFISALSVGLPPRGPAQSSEPRSIHRHGDARVPGWVALGKS